VDPRVKPEGGAELGRFRANAASSGLCCRRVRRRAAEHPAARILDRPPRRPLIRLGLEAPDQLLMLEQFHIPGRNMDKRMPIRPPTSISNTRVPESSLRRLASTHPARPTTDDHVICLHFYDPLSAGASIPARWHALSVPLELSAIRVLRNSANSANWPKHVGQPGQQKSVAMARTSDRILEGKPEPGCWRTGSERLATMD